MVGAIYKNHIGTLIRIRETMNSRLSLSGAHVYKVHHLWGTTDMWLPASEIEAFRKRWWRNAEAGEKFLKEYAEKHNWKQVEEVD